MNRKVITLFAFLVISGYIAQTQSNEEQIVWSRPNVKGYSIDPTTGQIDATEGFGGFDSIIKAFNGLGPRNFDNGGGEHDDNTQYLKEKYNIENIVYDPFMRPLEHNENALEQAQIKPFDTCTSISVLNVINTIKSRLAHIKICDKILKANGLAFFKVWAGNKSQIPTEVEGGYQSNKDIEGYIDEVKEAFGAGNVYLDSENKIIKAIKQA